MAQENKMCKYALYYMLPLKKIYLIVCGYVHIPEGQPKVSDALELESKVTVGAGN